jgi:hypothetical protein
MFFSSFRGGVPDPVSADDAIPIPANGGLIARPANANVRL